LSSQKYNWLRVWNHGILWLSIQLGISIHPKWRSPSFFRGVGLNHQPDYDQSLIMIQWYSMFILSVHCE
jgi:hypothetical protein